MVQGENDDSPSSCDRKVEEQVISMKLCEDKNGDGPRSLKTANMSRVFILPTNVLCLNFAW